MSTNHRNVKIIIAAIAIVLGASCGIDSQDAETPASAAPASAKLAPLAKIGPLKAAQREAVRRYDRNGNGALDVAEAERMASERKARVETLRVRLNGRYDKNHNGVLDRDEVQAMQADRDRLSVFQGAAVRRYDANHDGALDADEKQRMRAEREAFLGRMKGLAAHAAAAAKK